MRHWLGRICNGLRWTSALLCLITSTHLPAAEIVAPQVFLDGIHYQVTAELDEATDQPVVLRIGVYWRWAVEPAQAWRCCGCWVLAFWV